jgi:Lon protease-like protein
VKGEIPIFPLNTVLFPGGVLPLRIFEQRYLAMTKACLRDNTPFGACLIREGSEVGTPAVPCSVGCLATIAEWEMPQLGLFHLLARGGDRFRILRTRTASNGLIAADVEVLPALSERPPPDAACRSVLESVIGKVGADRFPAPIDLENGDWVAYRLAEILPIHLTEKQTLLEMDETAQRFEHLRRILGERGAAV